jgi:hypothetical protein
LFSEKKDIKIEKMEKILDKIENRLSLNPSICLLNKLYNFYIDQKLNERFKKFFVENKILQINLNEEERIFIEYLVLPSWQEENCRKLDESKKYFQYLSSICPKEEDLLILGDSIINFSHLQICAFSLFAVLNNFPSYYKFNEKDHIEYNQIAYFICQAVDLNFCIFKNIDFHTMKRIGFLFDLDYYSYKALSHPSFLEYYLEERGYKN